MANEIFLKSETGRAIRKDSFEAKHDMTHIESLLRKLYTNEKKSTTEIPLIFKSDYGIDIKQSACYRLIKKLGIMRNISESVSFASSTLNYDVKIINNELQQIINGIIIGDGWINANESTKVARVCISNCHKEFTSYCYRLLLPFSPNEPKFRSGCKGTGMWSICTKFHPDLYKIYKSWYLPNGVKTIPRDIIFSPVMVLLWYLGDGSLSALRESNSRSLYFATNCFTKEEINEILVPNFKKISIDISRVTDDCRLFVKTNSIVPLLNYMGGESPVECYSYKFNIENWRKQTTMKNVAKELNINYQRLANWVKTGFVKHSRSPGGRKVIFNESEMNELKSRLDSGELSREKHKKTKNRAINQTTDEINIFKEKNETQEDFIKRIVVEYQKNGFPYKKWDEKQLLKEWYGLRKSQYIIPNGDVIMWRKNSMPFADYFHPHLFELRSKNKISPMELFLDTEKFECALLKYIKMGGLPTRSGVLASICRNSCSKRLNNFSPLVARDIYNYYCLDGYCVLDQCSGFSGRLIGASISSKKISYTGFEPSTRTFYGLIDTKKLIEKTNPLFHSNILHECAETGIQRFSDESFDFAFTSPPYFDLEIYSNEQTQSISKYSEYDNWKNNFLKKIIHETYRCLKKDKFFVINIGKCEEYDIPKDTIDLATDCGFTVHRTQNIAFKKYQFTNNNKEVRLEPLIVLRKN